jgi:PRTRC genetic system protein F
VAPAVPTRVVFYSGDDGLPTFARWLVEAGVFQIRHWANGNLAASCEQALREFCHAARPQPLVKMNLVFSEADGHQTDWSESPRAYARRHQLKAAPAKIGVLNLHTDPLEPEHLNIGPTLRALEERRTGFGQTVLHTLESGLAQSCRGCGPRSAYEWAQHIYWCGEPDETLRHQEELDDRLSMWEENVKRDPENAGPKPTLADVEGLKKSDFDQAIPGWAGSGAIKPWSLRKLKHSRFPKGRAARVPHEKEIARATLALKQALQPAKSAPHFNDLGLFDHGCWEVVPFILRWNGYADPIGQIYDDVLNNEIEAGEREMDLNAIFAFHDGPTLRRALTQLQRYLHIMQLCENLIRLIGAKIK